MIFVVLDQSTVANLKRVPILVVHLLDHPSMTSFVGWVLHLQLSSYSPANGNDIIVTKVKNIQQVSQKTDVSSVNMLESLVQETKLAGTECHGAP